MEAELEEINELRRKGNSPRSLWEFIIGSKRHRKAWLNANPEKKLELKKWERIFSLIKGLKHRNADYRQKSAWALGELGEDGEQAISDLIEGLEGESNSFVKEAIIASLAKLDAKEAIPVLIKATEDENPIVRYHSVFALGIFGKNYEEVLRALAKALQDTDRQVRFEALAALKRIGTPEAIPLFKGALKDPELSMREMAKASLKGTKKTP